MPDNEPRHEPLSCREIGRILNMDPDRVRQIAEAAIRKLRRHTLMQEVAKEMGVLNDD